jgi:hypothetical protein
MHVPARDQQGPAQPAPAAARAAAPAKTTAARALALQRSAGNRAARRMLSRWTKHPDPEQKGVMVPDSSASAYGYFNPPKNE